MSMFNNPFFHLYIEPEAVNADGNYGEKKPFYVITEKLSARSVKNNLSAVYAGMTGYPVFFHAYSPRRGNAESKRYDYCLKYFYADKA